MRYIIIIVLATILSCNSCRSNKDTKPTEDLASENLDMPTLALQNNNFAFNLFREIRKTETENTVISPLSVTCALGMLNNGATGITRKEITNVLGYDNENDINAFCNKMIRDAQKLDKSTKITIANNIYVNKGNKLNKTFVKQAKQYYGATPECRDFGDGKTLDVINKWASDNTKKMIENVLDEDEFSPDAVSYLLNAIYFKGMWTKKFSKELTQEEEFNNQSKVMMMNQIEKFMYHETKEFQMVSLPYGENIYEMTIILPNERENINNIAENLNGKSWAELKGKMHNQMVDLKIPRFEINTNIDLIKPMSSLGMPSAFGRSASFDNFCDTRIYIYLMKQVAKIKLDEEGTEAAAVTVVGARKMSINDDDRPIKFHANRPFIYVISEKTTGTIFFIGQFCGE